MIDTPAEVYSLKKKKTMVLPDMICTAPECICMVHGRREDAVTFSCKNSFAWYMEEEKMQVHSVATCKYSKLSLNSGSTIYDWHNWD
jgi:hypothetical protein